jgi:hypothetical protein
MHFLEGQPACLPLTMKPVPMIFVGPLDEDVDDIVVPSRDGTFAAHSK